MWPRLRLGTASRAPTQELLVLRKLGVSIPENILTLLGINLKEIPYTK
jgi:hypothetical protein